MGLAPHARAHRRRPARRCGPGDQWVVNDPYLSGTHLNDVTVIRPIFVDGEIFGYACNKAHHADVGGMVPGSMPPNARELFAEGFIMPPMRLMRDDAVVPETVALFRANSRTPETRSGDLRAQLAGNVTGERRVRELVDRYGAATVADAIGKAIDDGERRMRAALRAFPDGVVEASDVMEDSERRTVDRACRLRLEKRGDRMLLDYTGTSPQLPMPLNAVYGVTLSGVYYAIRALLASDIPMNDGVFRPIEVYVPEGTLLNPHRPAPVSAGNVETSMRNADLVLAALGKLAPERVPAQSCGSMNNVMMGGIDERGEPWAFYETNGGGMGARPAADGVDAIQAHMTNTLNTPIEVLERTFPLRVTRYEFADDTAGAGRYRGGAGLVRALQVRAGTATISLLGERHAVRPHGSAGGGDGGDRAAHADRRHGCSTRTLPAKVTVQVNAGRNARRANRRRRRLRCRRANATPRRSRATRPTASRARADAADDRTGRLHVRALASRSLDVSSTRGSSRATARNMSSIRSNPTPTISRSSMRADCTPS